MRISKIAILLLACLHLCTLEGLGLKINIFSETNGKGLEMDKNMLSDALKCLGCEVHYADIFNSEACTFADINIFCQHLLPERLSQAKLNWLIPNPEWCF